LITCLTDRRSIPEELRLPSCQRNSFQWYSCDILVPGVSSEIILYFVGLILNCSLSSPVSHSVTQSSFADPCTHLAAANGSGPGFDSGLQKTVQFTIKITDDSKREDRLAFARQFSSLTLPFFLAIWFHCKQGTHCGQGMVG
jgi:hypothetical protein